DFRARLLKATWTGNQRRVVLYYASLPGNPLGKGPIQSVSVVGTIDDYILQHRILEPQNPQNICQWWIDHQKDLRSLYGLVSLRTFILMYFQTRPLANLPHPWKTAYEIGPRWIADH